MKIVFTGKGEINGALVSRASWYAAAEQQGHEVQQAVDKHTELLVASRTDTIKAREAERLGIGVITYDQFRDMLNLGESDEVVTRFKNVEPTARTREPPDYVRRTLNGHHSNRAPWGSRKRAHSPAEEWGDAPITDTPPEPPAPRGVQRMLDL